MGSSSRHIEIRTLGAVDVRVRGDPAPLQSVLAQPKRTALLVYLAAARPHGLHQRETLLGLFWPEMAGERARKALRQALYYLRASLGEDTLTSVGDSEVGLSPRVWCDAVEMDRALDEARWADGLNLYAGELLPGFYVDEAPEFERWLDAERDRLRGRAAEAAWQLADSCERSGDAPAALEWGRRAAALSTADEVSLRRLMALAERAGDRASALRHYEEFAERLAKTYDMVPSAATRQLADALRQPDTLHVQETLPAGSAEQQRDPQGIPPPFGRTQTDAEIPERRRRPGSLAIAALTAVAAIAVLSWSLRTAGPAATLVSSGTLPERPVIVFADFVNRTAEPHLAEAVAAALRIDFRQSRAIRVMDQAAVDAALQRMGRQPADLTELPVVREVARREGAAAVLTGEVAALGRRVMITGTLVAAEDGRVLLVHRAEAADRDDVIRALERLSAALRRSIGESLRSVRDSDPLPHVTTASLDALLLYSRSMRVDRSGSLRGPDAVALLQDAIARDSTFAMAYRRLAAAFANNGKAQLAAQAARRAYELRGRLPEPERSMTAASFREHVLNDRDGAVRVYRSLAERYPDDVQTLINLSDLLRREQDWAGAELIAARAVALRPHHAIAYSNLFYAQAAQRRYAEARSTIADLRRTLPEHHLALDLHAHLGEVTRDYDLARTYMDSLALSFPERRDIATMHHLHFYEIEGRTSEAVAGWDSIAAARWNSGRLDDIVSPTVNLARIDIRLLGDTAAAIRRVDEMLRRFRAESRQLPPPNVGPIAAAYAAAGAVSRARELLNIGDHDDRLGTPHPAMAMIAMQEGRYRDAVSAFQVINQRASYAECPGTWLFSLGRAQEAAGELDDAMRSYAAGVEAMGCNPRDLGLANAFLRLAALHDAKGQAAWAVDYYQRFVKLWQNADPELQPLVESARSRIARLSGTH